MSKILAGLSITALFILFSLPAFAADPVPNLPLDAMWGAVSGLYSFALKIVGLCVFVMFLIAGLGKILPERIRPDFMKDSWGIITNAVIGLVLLFSAFLILNTINPDLVTGGTQPATQAPTAP